MSRAARPSTAALATIHVVLPVLAGALVYVAWRSPSLRVFAWADSVAAGRWVETLRVSAAPCRARLPGFVLFCLPDGLWAYAFAASVRLVWAGSRTRSARLWWRATVAAVVVPELAQGFGLLPGTFDVWDLVVSIAAMVAAVFAVHAVPATPVAI